MSLLDQVRKLEQEVIDRLKELEPLAREYEQLRKVAERLGLVSSPKRTEADTAAQPSTETSQAGARASASKPRTPAKRQAKRSPARKRAAKPATKPRGARSTGTPRAAAARPGQRQDDVLALVDEHPGITVRELGERLGVDATGLYRVVKRLTEEGRVRKDGQGLHRVSPTAAAAEHSDGGDAAQPAAGGATPAPASAESAEPTP